MRAALAALITVLGVLVPLPAVAATGCSTWIHRATLVGYDEEQAAGIEASARWGAGAEVDLRHTSDGRLVLSHDNTLSRVTGGADKRRVESMTWTELQQVTLLGGGRIISLRTALRAARDSGAGLMVEIKQYDLDRSWWDSTGLPALGEVIRATRMQGRVYVGGVGRVEFMRQHPDLLTFYRVDADETLTAAQYADQGDLVQLDEAQYDPALVSALKALGVRVGTRNVYTREKFRIAWAAGLRMFQSQRGGMVNNWCREEQG